jgi:hypothetical protein
VTDRYPPCEHPYDGWKVDGVPLDREGFLVAQFVEGSPRRRGDDLTVARRPGALYRQKYYGSRQQQLVVWALKADEFGNVRGGAERNIDRLKRLFGGGLRQVELVRTLSLPFNRVSIRSAQVELVEALEGRRTALTQDGVYVQFQLDLLFADPFWREPENVVDLDPDGYGTSVVFNPGTVTSRDLVLRIEGPAVDPVVALEPGGTVTRLETTIAQGGFVEIDSGAYTAVDQDGASVAGSLDRDQVEIALLAPGRNEVTVTDGSATLSWRPAFL